MLALAFSCNNLHDTNENQEAYLKHLDQWFDKHKETNSPFINFTYNYLAGGQDELDNSIFFLKDAPGEIFRIN